MGGDSSAVNHQLRSVREIHGNDGNESAFAAILADGSVVSWGDPDFGGDNAAVKDQLKNV